MSSITWGALNPGSTTSMVLYVENEGSTSLTLTYTLSNVNPANLLNYLSVGWNYNNQPLAPGSTIEITLTLTVASNTPALSSFGFNTVITGTG